MGGNVCLIILIGLPASGKTTFAKLFLKNVMNRNVFGNRYNVVHICYDELMSNDGISVSMKDVRKNLISRVAKLVSSNLAGVSVQLPESRQVDEIAVKTLILVDDNMYYRSMRYEFYQLAREQALSFCQLYFKCTIEISLHNNSKRDMEERVPDDVIVRMSSKLEPPDPERNSWEKFSVTLPSCTYNMEVENSVLQLVGRALAEVVLPKKCVLFEDHEESRAACLSNFLHQVDILSRKLLGQRMVQKRNEGLSKKELSVISASLNTKRHNLLSKIKLGEIQYPQQVRLNIGSSDLIPENILQDWVTEIFDSA